MITTEKFRFRRSAVIGVAIVAAVGLGLSGCAGGGGGGGGEDVLAKIKKSGTINVGACLSVPPYGLIDSDGKPAGFDVEVAQELAAFLDVKVNVVDVNVASRIPSLQSQKLDLISCNFTINDERKKQIDYSDVMMYSGNSLLVRKDSSLASVKDLKGHTVAVSKGGTSVTVAKDNAPDAVQQPYETFASAVLALKQGQADSLIDIGTSVSDAAAKNPDLAIAVDGEVGPKVQFGLGVQKGQEALLTQVNAFVKKFHEEGRGKELFAKWAGVKPTFQFQGLEN
jgi:polar amino acid transport system substrate-binding protein